MKTQKRPAYWLLLCIVLGTIANVIELHRLPFSPVVHGLLLIGVMGLSFALAALWSHAAQGIGPADT